MGPSGPFFICAKKIGQVLRVLPEKVYGPVKIVRKKNYKEVLIDLDP
jgi:hypothetical protein